MSFLLIALLLVYEVACYFGTNCYYNSTDELPCFFFVHGFRFLSLPPLCFWCQSRGGFGDWRCKSTARFWSVQELSPRRWSRSIWNRFLPTLTDLWGIITTCFSFYRNFWQGHWFPFEWHHSRGPNVLLLIALLLAYEVACYFGTNCYYNSTDKLPCFFFLHGFCFF